VKRDLDPVTPSDAPPLRFDAIEDGPQLPTAAWHRKIRRMHKHWQAIHPAPGVLPARKHLDPLAVPDLLPNLWLLDVEAETLRLRYRLVGTRIVEAAGEELTGKWLDEAHPNLAHHPQYLDRYRAVVHGGRPSWRRGRARLWTNRAYHEIENIVLPFAGDGTRVDLLVVLTVLYRSQGGSE
jgi:hypothetical protein